jgi:SAM-dependent methyltransferase
MVTSMKAGETFVPEPATPLAAVWRDLRCPACRGTLVAARDSMSCACGKSFPIIDGRPVLLDEARSTFAHAEYHGLRAAPPPTGVRKLMRRFPALSVNLSAERCFRTMRELLAERQGELRVLVVGGGVMGKGMRSLLTVPGLQIVNVDPAPNSAAHIFCDGHDLPFADGAFDAVIVQAVLEHVMDPHRCVAEIHRVLAPHGLVYSETPFMQQVHMAGVDFTRFTHSGHRRLFRDFSEVESGVVAGPGTALAWSWRYFLASLSRTHAISNALYQLGRVTGVGFELADHLIRQRPGAIDAASCTYFLGRKSSERVDDQAILRGYRGQRQR